MAANNRKKKKIAKVVLAVAVVVAACVFLIFRGGEEGSSYSRSTEEFYESSYLDYLMGYGFDGAMSQGKVAVDVRNFTTKDGMEAAG